MAATTGLDATNTFLQALQGMGQGFQAGGQEMMQAAQNLGVVQLQAAVKQHMDDYQNQIDEIHASGADEVEQRRQIMQFQQKALMQVSSLGGNKEQLAAIQNLMPPIPNTAQEAMIRGQSTGDQTMFDAGKHIMDMEQKNKLEIISAEARNRMMLEQQTVDNNTAKALKEQAYKVVNNNQGTQSLRDDLLGKVDTALHNLGVSYNPQTKQLMNNRTKESVQVSNWSDVAAKVQKWQVNSVSTGLGASASGLLSKAGLSTTEAATHGALLNGLAQDFVESKAKLMGTRAIGTEAGRQFLLDNKATPGNPWALQVQKLIGVADSTNADNQYVKAQNQKLSRAIKSNSRSMADWDIEPSSIDYQSQAQAPQGGIKVYNGPSNIPGVNFNKRGP